MEGIPNKAWEALGPFPILQGALALIVVLACLYVAVRAARDKDRKPDPQQIPQWLMIGPAHDMMDAIYDLADQSRQQTDLLRRIDSHLAAILRQSEMNKATLEAIRNESRLR